MRLSVLRTKWAAVLVVGGSALLWVVRSSGQDVHPTPALGSGVVTVRGTVDIGQVPPISAMQVGEWNVALTKTADVRVTNTPTVALAPADFLKPGARYTVFWASGRSETIVVAQTGTAGWTRVEVNPPGGARRRWLNLAAAEAIEESTR